MSIWRISDVFSHTRREISRESRSCQADKSEFEAGKVESLTAVLRLFSDLDDFYSYPSLETWALGLGESGRAHRDQRMPSWKQSSFAFFIFWSMQASIFIFYSNHFSFASKMMIEMTCASWQKKVRPRYITFHLFSTWRAGSSLYANFFKATRTCTLSYQPGKWFQIFWKGGAEKGKQMECV